MTTTTETPETTTDPRWPTSELPPVHLARCPRCDAGAKVRPLTSGAGFTVLERYGVEPDYAFGVGANGRPECPNGHGEMPYTDEQLQAAEAFEQVAEQLDTPAKQRLPFPAPPINYEAFFHAIRDKRHDVAQLEARFNDADDRRKKAKAALDTANEELGQMIDDLEERETERLNEIERRQDQAAAGHPEGTNLVRCAYERQHPDETCPMCGDPEAAVRRGFTAVAASDAHIVEAEEFARLLDVDELVDELLTNVSLVVDPTVVLAWTQEERDAVNEWIEVECAATAEEDRLPKPACLGTAHVAAGTITSESPEIDGDTFQCCATCGARLRTVKTAGSDELEAYPTGQLVGVDCPGEVKEATHRYPQKTKGKKKGSRG